MVASIITVVVFALVLGVALGLLANAGDRQNLKDAQKKIDELRGALVASRLECVEQRTRDENRITGAQEAISDDEEIFDEQEKRKQSTRPAVILPFKSS
jgi:hypothetical protein